MWFTTYKAGWYDYFFSESKGWSRKDNSINKCCGLSSGQGNRVLLIDADKRGSASSWARVRGDDHPEPFSVIGLARGNMAKDAMEIARGFNHTIIDGPPHAEEISRSYIIASDFVAIPIEPSGLSTWSSDLTVRQVREAQEYKPSLKCGFVVSRKIANTVIGRDIRELAAASGIPVLASDVAQRVAFAESLTMGKTIGEWLPGSAAEKDINNLTEEICDYDTEKIHKDS